jgi:hypothetical protein
MAENDYDVIPFVEIEAAAYDIAMHLEKDYGERGLRGDQVDCADPQSGILARLAAELAFHTVSIVTPSDGRDIIRLATAVLPGS